MSTQNSKNAFLDTEFMEQEEMRAVRLKVELQKVEHELATKNINNAVAFFGSARAQSIEVAKKNHQDVVEKLKVDGNNPDLHFELKKCERMLEHSLYLEEATKLAKMVSCDSQRNLYVFTGGGPGFMEASNKGAYEANKKSVALNIKIPKEQKPNDYITPELSFSFKYFSIRKMHLLIRAKAIVVFPGGFGTMDELFEALTLIQTKKMKTIPIILFCKDFWTRTINFESLAEDGFICRDELKNLTFCETAKEAWDVICKYYP